MYPRKGPAQRSRPDDVVDTVQAADAGVHGIVEVQLLHVLAQKQRRFGQLEFRGLFRCHGKHVGGEVDPVIS